MTAAATLVTRKTATLMPDDDVAGANKLRVSTETGGAPRFLHLPS
jgi:hypothetical protein